MSDLVPSEDIERIVGIQRHNVTHYGRAECGVWVDLMPGEWQPSASGCPHIDKTVKGLRRGSE